MNCKVILIEKVGKKDGKDTKYSNYYVELENGKLIAFRPSFPNDYAVLRAVAEKKESK